ncbi:MAG: hypothetical protein J6J58_02440 [Oscillospiraceae bacterium]|nr:hypothetical protein [Oscillospiraceae bacterium]
MIKNTVLILVAAVMLFLFIKDSPVTKKIWAVAVAAVSAAATVYSVIVYCGFKSDVNSQDIEYASKAKYIRDFNVYIVCIAVLMLITALLLGLGYYTIKKQKNSSNPDVFVEYIIIGTVLAVAIAVYFTGTSFALTHMSKYFDVSFYPTAVSSAMIGTIVANVLLYMKILQ